MPNHLKKRDSNDYLIHLTHRTDENTAFENLIEIANSQIIHGNNQFIKGSHNCVCFTESALVDIVSYIQHHNKIAQQALSFTRPRYELYGIAIRKAELFFLGARPVIYQLDEEYNVLPAELQYRHMRLEPNAGIDFSWEREWRLQTDHLDLSALKTTPILLVRTIKESIEIQNRLHFDKINEINAWAPVAYTPCINANPFPWPIIPLEIF